jgi:hypothetical protein
MISVDFLARKAGIFARTLRLVVGEGQAAGATLAAVTPVRLREPVRLSASVAVAAVDLLFSSQVETVP